MDYENISLTENTRVSYPIYHIDNIVQPISKAGHANKVIFLTADAFGVLPAVSILSNEEAQYHFLSGFTAKLAGTERGVDKPTPTFSACFGAAFLTLHPTKYAEVLSKRMKMNNSKAYLVNTGWNGRGERISLKNTRSIIDNILNDKIDNKLNEDMNYLQKEFFIEDLLKVLSQKKKIDINEEVVNLELKRKYQIDLSKMKDEHKERIDSLKKLTSENIQKDVLFSELVKFLNVKVEQKELQEYIQKYYGEKIDQRTAEAAYGTLLRNKIADESMKTFKIKETKLSLEELMKKGSQNNESSTHSH